MLELSKPSPRDDYFTLTDKLLLMALADASFEKLPRGRPPRCFACRRYILDGRRPLASALVMQPYCEDNIDAIFAYGVCAECTDTAGGDQTIFARLAGQVRQVIGVTNISNRLVAGPGRA
jgi:hypothetical protein